MEDIIHGLTPYVMRLCSDLYITGYEKDDLVQLSHITLLQAVKKYNGTEAGAFAYLVTAVRNNLYCEIRKRNCKPVELSYEAEASLGREGESAAVEEGEEAAELYKKRLQALRWAVTQLTSEERELIQVLFYSGEKAIYYSRRKGISNSLCSKRKGLTLKKLKLLIEKRIVGEVKDLHGI